MSKRRLNPALFIALADVMMCWAGRLFLEINRDAIDREIEIAQLEERKAEAEAEAEEAMRKAQDQIDEATQRAEDAISQAVLDQQLLEEEMAAKKASLDARISQVEAQLSKRQDDFQNWDLVVQRYYHKNEEDRGLTRRPDAHLYLRESGIYRDGRKEKMSDAEIVAWLEEQVALTGQTPDGHVLLASWQENGANDGYIRMLDILDDHPDLANHILSHTIILPSGVRADSSQKGTERIRNGGDK